VEKQEETGDAVDGIEKYQLNWREREDRKL
jgi:hypothetical protein